MNKRDLKLDKYGISGKRYKELSAFCEQYPEWKDELLIKENPMKSNGYSDMPKAHNNSSVVEDIVIRCDELNEKCSLIDETAKAAADDLAEYIIKSVCYEKPLWYLRDIMSMPCSDRAFYDKRRYFFFLLNKRKRM